MPQPRSYPVVLIDTNMIVKKSWRMSNDWWRVVLAESQAGVRTVVVPEIVVREAVQNFRAELNSAHVKLSGIRRDLRKLGVRSDLGDMNVDAAVSAYEVGLIEQLTVHAVVIDRTPDDGLRDHIDRLLNRRKPFKDNGAGVADAVIWSLVVARAHSLPAGAVAFISNNSTDFGNGRLHDDLVADLIGRGLRERVQLFNSLQEFVTSQVPENHAVHAKALDLAARALAEDMAQIGVNIGIAVEERGIELSDALGDVEVVECDVVDVSIASVNASRVEGIPDEWATVVFATTVDLRLSVYAMAPHINNGDAVSYHTTERQSIEVTAAVDVLNGEIYGFSVDQPLQIRVDQLW